MTNGDAEGLALVGSIVPVSRETSERLTVYARLLRQWQSRINLVAPSTLDELWARHIADSVQSFTLAQDARRWIDLGSGAGFPGLVVAMLMADGSKGRVDLIESNGKKCAFLRTVVRECGLKAAGVEVEVHNGRIEHVLGDLPEPDVVSARALAPLEKLLEFTHGVLSGDAIGLFSKGREHGEELARAALRWDFDVDSTPSRLGDQSVLLKISNVRSK